MYVFAMAEYHVKRAGPCRCAEPLVLLCRVHRAGIVSWIAVEVAELVILAEEVVGMVADVAVVAEFAKVMVEIAVVIEDSGPISTRIERDVATKDSKQKSMFIRVCRAITVPPG